MPDVLLVDDDPDIRQSFQDLLEEEGYTVHCARDGEEGLEMVSALQSPCLIVLDLIMPRMDGIEFLARLREDPARALVPVIVVSASSTVRPPPEVPMLKKPVTIDRFLSAIKAHCR